MWEYLIYNNFICRLSEALGALGRLPKVWLRDFTRPEDGMIEGGTYW